MLQGTDPRILRGPQSRSWSWPLLYFSHDGGRLFRISTAPTAPASTPGLRARRLGPRLRRARRLRAARAARGARLLIPAGGGGAGARAGLAVAGRGPSHQRWRGAEGRAEQAGWVGSGLRVAMAASTPGRARLAQGGAAQSGGRPRPRPAPRPSARSPAPSLEPPPPRPARGK